MASRTRDERGPSASGKGRALSPLFLPQACLCVCLCVCVCVATRLRPGQALGAREGREPAAGGGHPPRTPRRSLASHGGPRSRSARCRCTCCRGPRPSSAARRGSAGAGTWGTGHQSALPPGPPPGLTAAASRGKPRSASGTVSVPRKQFPGRPRFQ